MHLGTDVKLDLQGRLVICWSWHHPTSCAHAFYHSLAPMTSEKMKRNPEETLKCIFFHVLSWKEGRDEGQLLVFRRASLSESTKA